jgi:hypothetical protein
MTWVGFELKNPGFEGAKTFHALDRAATVIGKQEYHMFYFVGNSSSCELPMCTWGSGLYVKYMWRHEDINNSSSSWFVMS